MPKKKTDAKLTPEEQAKRFKEAAEKAGLTAKEDELSRAFEKIVRAPPVPTRKISK